MKKILLVVICLAGLFRAMSQAPAALRKKFTIVKELWADLYAFSENGKQGVVNKTGQVICKPVFPAVVNTRFGLLTVSNDTFYGLASMKGELLLPYHFDELAIISASSFAVEKNGVTFLVDKKNLFFDYLDKEIHTPYSYYKTYFTPPVILSEEYLTQQGPIRKMKLYEITGTGDTVYVPYTSIGPLWESGTIMFEKEGLWGIAATDGRIIQPAVFENISLTGNSFYIVKKNGLYGTLSLTGGEMIPAEYLDISYSDENKMLLLEKKENGHHLYGLQSDDRTLEWSLAPRHIRAYGKLYEVEGTDAAGTSIFLDRFLTNIFPSGYHYHQISGGEFFVTNDSLCGVLNEAGYFIFPPVACDEIRSADGAEDRPGKYLMFRKGDKWGLMNRKGQITVQPLYSDINLFYEGQATAELNNKHGVMNSKGIAVIPFIYDKISFKADKFSHYRVMQGNKYGLSHKTGKLVTPISYDYISEEPEGGLYLATQNGKSGFLDATGKAAIPLIYDEVNPFYSSETTTVKKDGKTFRINKKGQPVGQ